MLQINTQFTGSPMVSLYEYRGKPDLDKIGKKVFEFSKYCKVKLGTRNLGPNHGNISVMLYPQSFLDTYFHLKELYDNSKKYF